MWKMWKKKEPQRPERTETPKEGFLSKLIFASFYASGALFFSFTAILAFLIGLFQPKNALALLTFLLSLLPPVLTLTSSTLLKTLEDKKSQKRLAASISFIAISFPGSWLAGVIFRAMLDSLVFQEKNSAIFQEEINLILQLASQGGLWKWILGILEFIAAPLTIAFYVFYILFLIFPYRASASHLVGILLDVAREGGLFKDTTQATPQEKA